ncbi:matrixin family metalloprotease [Planctomycetota bacterium]
MNRISRRFVLYTPLALVVAAALSVGTASYAYIRLATSSTGAVGLYWAAQPVSFAIHSSGSDDLLEDDRDLAAVRMAFETWQRTGESALQFSENHAVAVVDGVKQARNDGNNVVIFDENNSTGLFSGASFVVAITPVFFDTASGRILDADIVFNGANHSFTTRPGATGESGKYDIQNIATHEVGHFVGLDHSAVHGATMVPYATPGETRLRSLSSDERAALRTVYPGGAPVGAISGVVTHRSTGSGVNGAHVVATRVDTGETATSVLSSSNGSFVVTGLMPGLYSVFAEPLDGPTRDGNIQRNGVDTGFATTFAGSLDYPEAVGVSSGQSTSIGTIAVAPGSGLNVEAALPRTVRRGVRTPLYVQRPVGAPSLQGCSVEITGSGISYDPTVGSGGRIAVTVSAGTRPGMRDVILRRGSGTSREMVILAGGLEIVADPPHLSAITPEGAPAVGGTVVEIMGMDFEPGIRIAFGDQVVPLGDVVFDRSTSLTVVTPPAYSGPVLVTVINPDGQESRLEGGFQFTGPDGLRESKSASYTYVPVQSAPQPTRSGGGGCSLAGEGTPAAPLPLLLLVAILALAYPGRYDRSRTA